MALWRTVARTVATAGIAVSIGLVPAAPAAHAAPSVDEIERQLDEAWEEIEPVIEQYNKVHSQLEKNKKKAEELQQKIQPLELRVDLAMTRVGAMAAAQYKQGPTNNFQALLQTGSPTALAEQLTLLDILARNQHEQIAAVQAARDKFANEKKELDQLVAAQKKQEADVKTRRKAIQAEIDKLEKLRQASVASTGALRIGACPSVYVGGAAGIAARTACAQIGKPYVFGAVGPSSFDCSGLTQYAWRRAGKSLTHYTAAQWSQTTPVSRDNARTGDLVFFYSDLHHVGIYVGNGLMVHAPRTGKPVQMAKVDVMPIAGFRRP